MSWRSTTLLLIAILLFETFVFKSDEWNRNDLIDYFREFPLEDVQIRIPISLNPDPLKLPDLAESSQIQTNYELNRINQGLICQYKVEYYAFCEDCYFQMDLIVSDNDAVSVYQHEPIIDLYHQLQSVSENDLPFFVSQAALYHLLESELEYLGVNHYTKVFTEESFFTVPKVPIDLESVCVNDTKVMERLSRMADLDLSVCEERNLDIFLDTVVPHNLILQVDKAIRLKFLHTLMSFHEILLQINTSNNKYKEKHSLFRNALQKRKEAVDMFNSNHWDEALVLLNRVLVDGLEANELDLFWWFRSALYGLILIWALVFQ